MKHYLILNGNGQRSGVFYQTHETFDNKGWTIAIRMSGIKHCRFTNLTIRNARTFCGYINYMHDVIVDNCNFEFPSTGGYNYDGWKCVGPATNYIVNNIKGNCIDDIVSVSSNDGFTPYSPIVNSPNSHDPSASYGDIDRVEIKNITFLSGSVYPIRLMSTVNKISNVTIDGVHGITGRQLIVIDNYEGNSGLIFDNDKGYFHNIKIKNVDAELNAGGTLGIIRLCGIFSNIEIEGITRKNLDIEIPYISTSTTSIIDSLSVNNINILPNQATKNKNFTLFKNEGSIKNLSINNVIMYSDSTYSGLFVLLNLLGYVTNVKLSNLSLDNVTNILSCDMQNKTNLQATNVANINGRGVAFENTNSVYGPLKTILSNIISDTTILSGLWSGQKGDAFL